MNVRPAAQLCQDNNAAVSMWSSASRTDVCHRSLIIDIKACFRRTIALVSFEFCVYTTLNNEHCHEAALKKYINFIYIKVKLINVSVTGKPDQR